MAQELAQTFDVDLIPGWPHSASGNESVTCPPSYRVLRYAANLRRVAGDTHCFGLLSVTT
jgi:hypothetical protein